MIWGYIVGDGNRTEAQTRGWGSGINYREMRTRSINRNERVARVARVLVRGWML